GGRAALREPAGGTGRQRREPRRARASGSRDRARARRATAQPVVERKPGTDPHHSPARVASLGRGEAVRGGLGGVQVFFPPGAFGQSNLLHFEEIVSQVARWVPDGARVLEFHAGCGAVGLGLLSRVERVVFNEIAPPALEGLALGLAARPEEE